MSGLSVRSSILTRRTYCRPLNEEGTIFESFSQVLDRVISHQRWLWERALGDSLNSEQEDELLELRGSMEARRTSAAGRTLWLGGTELVKRREASSFNCSYVEVRTVHDVVDVFWNLLQGCGVGFKPIKGALFGFTRRMEVEVIRSEKTSADGKGRDSNIESYDPETRTWAISVGDSAEAWAKLAGKIVAGKHPAKRLVIDLREIRAGGSRLKGYGWICSGDGPLATAILAIGEILNRRAGQLLSKNDIVDVVNWLGTVLSSRRSAEIALMEYGDPEWREFATRKPPGFDSGPMWFRGQSNNSLLFWERPTKRQIRDLFEMMVEHGGGEPGVVNGRAAMARAPWFGGLNPCVTKDTWVMTDEGPRQVESLISVPFQAIVNGDPHASTADGFFSTGKKPVFLVETDRGYSFRVTANHEIMKVNIDPNGSRRTEWIPLSELSVSDQISLHNHRLLEGWEGRGSRDEGWLLGNLFGNGTFSEVYKSRRPIAKLSYWGKQKENAVSLAANLLHSSVGCRSDVGRCDVESATAIKHDRVSISSVGLAELAADYGVTRSKTFDGRIEETSSDFHSGFLSGWFDADGTVVGDQSKGISVRLCSVSLPEIYAAQRMLARLGIMSTVYTDRHQAGLRSMPDGRGGHKEYECRATNELVIARDNIGFFRDRVGFTNAEKAEKLDGLLAGYRRAPYRERFIATIVSIKPDGEEEVYDCTIPTASQFDGNGVNLHNCAEILLAVYGYCNLSEIDLAKYRGEDALLARDSWLLARMNYRQTLVNLRDGVLQDAWHQTNENLRLCGVGVTGVARRPEMTPYAYRRLRSNIVAGSYSMADELGLPRPGNVTTIKPSGTLSKAIFDTTEGAHKPKARHIFNNVNFSRHDPLVMILLDAGYRVMDHPNDPTSVLITLPGSYPDVQLDSFGGYEVDKESAVSQMNRYKMLMESYCDQNVSITVSYDPSEIKDMVEWIYANWDSYVAMSFLFRNDVTKTAKDLGFAYLPQETVTREAFDSYVSSLKPVDVDVDSAGFSGLASAEECPGGACPIR